MEELINDEALMYHD